MNAAVKERGMFFIGESVRAILEGRKTQTRRVMRPQPPEGYRPGFSFFTSPGEYEIRDNTGNFAIGKVPYGAKGDHLWVRETWCPVDDTEFGGEKWIDYRATPKFSAEHPAGWENAPQDLYALKWKSPRFMPRWASRITLEIKNIRVERVQEISYADCIAEGMTINEPLNNRGLGSIEKDAYANLFDRLNAKRGYPWISNPWVWVIEFLVYSVFGLN